MISTTIVHLYRRCSALLFGVMVLAVSVPFVGASTVYQAGFPIAGVLHSGKAPEAVAVDTETHILYIAHESNGLIVAFNGASGKVVWRASVDDVVTDIQVDSASHLVFATSVSYRHGQHTLSVLSGATGQILAHSSTGAGDDGIAVDATRKQLYVAATDDGIVYQYALAGDWTHTTLSLTRTTERHLGSHPEAIGVDVRLGRLYVADSNENVLRVVDEATMHVVTTVPLGADPVHPLRIDEKTGYVYIVCSGGQELDVVNGSTGGVVVRVPVGPYPEGLTIDTATGRIYIADEGNNEHANTDRDMGTTISVVDGKTFAFLGTLQVGKAPDGVASDPALHRIYVALEDSNAVVEVSDSIFLPLKIDETLRQVADARQAVQELHWASVLTVCVMLATLLLTTYVTWMRTQRHRSVPQEPLRAMESPRIPRGDASSQEERHSLRS